MRGPGGAFSSSSLRAPPRRSSPWSSVSTSGTICASLAKSTADSRGFRSRRSCIVLHERRAARLGDTIRGLTTFSQTGPNRVVPEWARSNVDCSAGPQPAKQLVERRGRAGQMIKPSSCLLRGKAQPGKHDRAIAHASPWMASDWVSQESNRVRIKRVR